MSDLNAQVDWLLNSGIQNISGPHAGGFNGWYDTVRGNYPFIYSEITGYGITSLLFANTLQERPIFIERANMAAKWLLNRSMHACCGVSTRAYYEMSDPLYSFENNIIFAFDTGMVLSGLVNLFTETKITDYLDASIKIGKFLITLQKPNGLFYAAYDANKNEYVDTQDKWSLQSGSYQAKIAIGLIDLYKISGDNTFRQAALAACDGAINMQQKNGRFITQQSEKSTHVHPHCYSAEGLAYVSLITGNVKYMRAAAEAIAWVLDNQMDNGGIPCKYMGGEFIKYQRSDTLAQTLRLGAFMHSNGVLGGYERGLERLASRLLRFQNISGPHAGGFFYGTELDGTQRKHINSWCSMFAMQAIFMHELMREGKVFGLEFLI